MSDHAAPEKTISPKVIAQGATSLGLAIVVGAIAAITPEHFAMLGMWGPVVYAGVVAGGGVIAGWITRDPLRSGGQGSAS